MTNQPTFVTALYRLLDRLEIVFLGAAVISLLLQYAGYQPASSGLMISLTSLAVVYFLNGYKPPSSEQTGEKKDFTALLSQTILPKVLWISCAVGTIGILFHLLNLPGAQQMLMIAAASNAFGVVLFLILSAISSTETQKLAATMYRVVPLLLICGYLLLRTAE